MPPARRNVEIKLRCDDLDAVATRLRDALGARDLGVLLQEDVFFTVPQGRLKLRLQPRCPAQLIAYARHDAAALRPSEYRIVECADGLALRGLLAATLGEEAGVVRKRRQLFLLDNVRVHLDAVEGLGSFVEIEAVQDEAHDEAACYAAARRIMHLLDLQRCPRESQAYVDLLQTRR